MTTPTELCNMALAHLGQARISDYSERSPAAEHCRRAFDHTRRLCLRDYDWNFAIRRAILTAAEAAPAFDWGYSYPLPEDCLRVLSVNQRPGGTRLTDYAVEGRSILTNSAECRVRYVADATDVTDWDSVFCSYFAYRLAAAIAPSLRLDPQAGQQMEQMAAAIRDQAREADAVESQPRVTRLDQSEIIEEREGRTMAWPYRSSSSEESGGAAVWGAITGTLTDQTDLAQALAAKGDVSSPSASTDNAITRFDGTTGKLIQNSLGTIDDAGLLTVPDASVTGTLTAPHIHGNLAGSIYSHVRNESGGLLTKGTPVYIVGYSVGQSRPLVAAAASGNPASMPAIGILDADLANNASGHCVIIGTIENFNTAAYSVNAPLYVASGGGLTATAPSVRAQSIAIVERVNANNGAIIVTAADVSGSMSQQAANAVSITGGTISGLTSISAVTGAITGSTASTSTGTGALVVTGGVGIGGALYAGADSFFNGVRVGRGNDPINSSTAVGASALAVSTRGAATIAITTAGSGGVTGPTIYNGVQLTYVSGPTATTYPTVDITVTSGAVTAITIITRGTGFTAPNTVLSCSSAAIGGVTGFTATVSTTVGGSNTAIGNLAMLGATTAQDTVAVGTRALQALTTAGNCVGVGYTALGNVTTGGNNIGIGYGVFNGITTQTHNVGIGTFVALTASTGVNNTIVGSLAGRTMGAGTGSNWTGASNNVLIGYDVRPLDATNNQIVIGASAVGDGQNTTVIGTPSTTQSRLYGGDAFNTGANGQSNVFGQASTPLTGFTGATRTATALIPANCIVIGVSCRVITAITGATSFDIGDGTTANLFASAVPVALGSTSNLVIAPKVYATATNVVCTANGGNFTAGAVRLTVHYMRIVAPTS
jgi:hypothetical protein